MRIALFTPFSPDIGGGSVQLRSHLRNYPIWLSNGSILQLLQSAENTAIGWAAR